MTLSLSTFEMFHLILPLLLLPSCINAAYVPTPEKDQWPSGHGCPVIDGLVCGNDIGYFCERETGYCVKCAQSYCNSQSPWTNSELCQQRCPVYYSKGYFSKDAIGPTRKVHSTKSIVTLVIGSVTNIISTTGSVPNDTQSSKSITLSYSTEHSLVSLVIPRVKSKVWHVMFAVVTCIIVSVAVMLVVLFVKMKITRYHAEKCIHLPVPDSDHPEYSLEEIKERQCPVLDRPTDSNTDSKPNEHSILLPDEKENLDGQVVDEIDGVDNNKRSPVCANSVIMPIPIDSDTGKNTWV